MWNIDRFGEPAAVAGIALVVTIIVLLQFPDIKYWQTLIGGLLGGSITAAGIWAASYNVTRQMKLTVKFREEDRIERELPGFWQAVFLTDRFRAALQFSPERAVRILETFDELGLSAENIAALLDTKIPKAPERTRDQMAVFLSQLRDRARECVEAGQPFGGKRRELMKRSQDNPDDTDAGGIEMLNLEETLSHHDFELNAACDRFLTMIDGFKRHIESLEKTLESLRGERAHILRTPI